MSARWTPPLGMRGEAASAQRGASPDALAALIRAQQAVTRTDVAWHLFDAVRNGLPAADARQALAEWDKANRVQIIGCCCGQPLPVGAPVGCCCGCHT